MALGGPGSGLDPRGAYPVVAVAEPVEQRQKLAPRMVCTVAATLRRKHRDILAVFSSVQTKTMPAACGPIRSSNSPSRSSSAADVRLSFVYGMRGRLDASERCPRAQEPRKDEG